ncbi:MAG: hypothetical protein WBA77_00540 [Microcoleaceae cyanobacterium]
MDTEKTIQEKLPPLNNRWIDMTIAFIKGLALILIFSGILGLAGCSSEIEKVGNWQSATKLHSVQLLMQVITENSSPSAPQDIYEQLQAIPLTNKLTLFKFNHPGFCGQFGCLHTAYLQTQDEFKKVWARYLDPHLPRNTPLIQLVKEPPNGKVAQNKLPCLQFNQITQFQHLQHQTTECFDGQDYQIVEKRNLLVVKPQKEKTP